ncbi:MAG: hypothetical protein M1833_003693 [Piccolia ochrophora]|nr:MAG: hypothetical protein M1833_003693 [Piccolia ochrophora]
MRHFFALVVSSLLLGFVAAQNSSKFDVGLVPDSLKASWCQSEKNACPELCAGPGEGPDTNDCDLDTLEFECVCTNGSSPALEAYAGTIPAFICQETIDQCINANENNANGQKACRDSQTCGTLNSSEVNAAAASASAASSASGTATLTETATSTATETAAAASTTGAAPAQLGADWGTGMFAASMALLFGALL